MNNFNSYYTVLNFVLTGVGCMLQMVAEKVTSSWIQAGSKISSGSLKKSFLVVVMVSLQLLVSVSVARAIIFFLLLTSGDVEQNPGPECMLHFVIQAGSCLV